jgi:mono/diheme cytochrome c family protein
MTMKRSIIGFVGLLFGLALCAASCFPEPNALQDMGLGGAGGSTPAATAGTAPDNAAGAAGEPALCTPRPKQDGAQCHPVVSSEPLLARAVDGVPTDRTVFSTQIYTGLKSYCGGCHVDNSLGNFHFTSGTFAQVIDQKVIDAIQSNVEVCPVDGSGNKVDPTCFDFMPPTASGGKKFSDREKDPADPLKPLLRLLTQWIAQGRGDTFIDKAQADDTAPYSISADLAAAFTNIGTCVPDAGMVGTEQTACDMDTRFAAIDIKPTGTLDERLGLPLTLDQTDLTTYDSAELAKNNVVAYTPAYPLWTDDAGKLRYVRVPVGQAITYNKKTKQFDIPANTRFYKTFMKKVKGVDGVTRYHKIETRVIVSRPRDANGADRSLFGTYEWNDDETQAELLTDPQNNGEPFVDKVKTVITDEGIAVTVKALVKSGKVRNFSYEMDSRHATRRYAFPSYQRCIQCHMGSPSESFILGFTPLQLNTRPCAPETIAANGHCDAGQVEPAAGDELTQVQRLTDYGVISGYGEAQLQKLEDPQGTSKAPRPMRSTEELVAQAYMLGNCSHCHNPNGYPSVEHPELKPLLNFLPSSVGGIFGFPLERYSPRIFRNVTSDGPMPYITPSLRDRYGDKANGWTEKVVRVPGTNGAEPTYAFIDAPWRSLIYRNADTPFTYTDDSAIYPHMPLNSPGFDCRAPRILGEWMVSIPALPKNPNLTEDVVPGESPTEFTELSPQPYREVKPGDAEYENGLAQAQQRLQTFRAGLRDAQYCPDTSDIIDLAVERSNNTQLIPKDGEVTGLPKEGVPDRPHWVSIDLTNPPGPWNPRRTDWKQIIVDQDFKDAEAAAITDSDKDALHAQEAIVGLLHDTALSKRSKFLDFANTPLPFGVWQRKAACKFDSVKKLADYTGADRPRWMDIAKFPDGTAVTSDSPVYAATPGSLVFNMICVNCHGPDADSAGRQAQTLAEMTGGTARVANFRDGLFGPFGKGGENRKPIFGTDDVASRYLPWMALGGTKVKIPPPILNLVANTPVLGVSRRGGGVSTGSANMLQVAQVICGLIAGLDTGPIDPTTLNDAQAQVSWHTKYTLIPTNGDAELWEKLCTFDNPAPVHELVVVQSADKLALSFNNAADLYFAGKYPANAAVGDGAGRSQPSLTADNVTPWCVLTPTDPKEVAYLATLKTSDGSALPMCPNGFISPDNRFKTSKDANGKALRGDIDDWAARGAINAGQAVFLYLDRMISKGKGREPRYDECEQLGN